MEHPSYYVASRTTWWGSWLREQLELDGVVEEISVDFKDKNRASEVLIRWYDLSAVPGREPAARIHLFEDTWWVLQEHQEFCQALASLSEENPSPLRVEKMLRSLGFIEDRINYGE